MGYLNALARCLGTGGCPPQRTPVTFLHGVFITLAKT